MKVHVLVDDRVRKRGLLAEHGLSLWIEKDGKKILFDTGQTDVFVHNAKVMGINLESADYIVLSHGHYDHCGGLQFFPYERSTTKIHIHPGALWSKYASKGNNEPEREVGIPWDLASNHWMENRMVYTQKPVVLSKGIKISGEIPRTGSLEETPRDFLVKINDTYKRDIIKDEQMLVIEQNDELAVFLGCSHPGVINCLDYSQELFPGRKIKLLVAGMHLENVSRERLVRTFEHISDLNINTIIPLHCTGFEAMCEMKRIFKERCLLLTTGDTIRI